MDGTSIGASMTHAFDPAKWLEAFERVGGAYTVTDRLNLFIFVPGRTDDELSQARQMIVDLTMDQDADLVEHLETAFAASMGEC